VTEHSFRDSEDKSCLECSAFACFTLVGVAFWRFGWKIGLLDFLLVFIASNVGLRWHKYLRKGSGL
jgi:hypothetical protein